MSLKWYEQHLQKIVKENQALRFQAKKKPDTQGIIQNIHKVFKELFPTIPQLENKTNLDNIPEILTYYSRAGKKWIQMIQNKLIVMEENQRVAEKNSERNKSLTVVWEFHQNQKDQENCVLCGRPKDKLLIQKLNKKLAKHEEDIKYLEQYISQLQRQQQEYLKEISQLRSITKKLQYEMAEQQLTYTSMKKAFMKKQKEKEAEMEELKKQGNTWRDEYDRLWQEQFKNNLKVSKSEVFQEQRQLLNALEQNKSSQQTTSRQ